MIKEFEFYHGAVLARLLHGGKRLVSVQPYPSPCNASYALNENVGLYIKHSTKRMSPWRFSFAKEHQDEMLEMKNKLGNVFLVLVCDDDGIVALSFEEVKKVLNDSHEPVEWISVARNKNKEYAIKGSDGNLGYKISRKEFPDKVLDVQKRDKVEKKKIFSWLG
jgi:hypothetical protein